MFGDDEVLVKAVRTKLRNLHGPVRLDISAGDDGM